MKHKIVYGLLFFFSGCSPTVENGMDVIHQVYENQEWHPDKNMICSKNVVFYKNDTVALEEKWKQYISSPGMMRLEYGYEEAGRFSIYKNDSIYNFIRNQFAGSSPLIHYILLLSQDVYFLDPDKTISKLKKLGFNLRKMKPTRWNGTDIYIVGTDDIMDTRSNQFWIDRDSSYLVRIIYNQGGSRLDITFSGYRRIDRAWVYTELDLLNNGKKLFSERYFDFIFPEVIADSLFATGF